MFETFVKAPEPPPSPAEIQAREGAMSSAEVKAAAKAMGIILTQPESSRSCMTCSHFKFVALDYEADDDRLCVKGVPVLQADGSGRWPQVQPDDVCDGHRPVQTSAHQGRGEQERRRLLMSYLVKLKREKTANAKPSSKPKRQRKGE